MIHKSRIPIVTIGKLYKIANNSTNNQEFISKISDDEAQNRLNSITGALWEHIEGRSPTAEKFLTWMDMGGIILALSEVVVRRGSPPWHNRTTLWVKVLYKNIVGWIQIYKGTILIEATELG